MLSRPPTKISLTTEDIIAYEQRKMMRDAVCEQQMDGSVSQDTSNSTVEDGDASLEQDLTPAQQTRAAKAAQAQRVRMEREARLGIGRGGRG